MCTRNQAEEILHSVYAACSPIFGRIHDAYLYGSYARGDFTPETDIDILLTVDLEQAEIAKHRSDVATVTSRLSLEYKRKALSQARLRRSRMRRISLTA